MSRAPLKQYFFASAGPLILTALVACADTGGQGVFDLDALTDVDLDTLGDIDLDTLDDTTLADAADAPNDAGSQDTVAPDTAGADAEDVQGGGDADDADTDDVIPDPDAATDASVDSDTDDVGSDAAADVSTDVGDDVSTDVGDVLSDVVEDVSGDVLADSGEDASDTSADASADGLTDATTDVAGDADVDAAADTTADAEPDAALPFCGDGVRNLLEQCDGADLDGETCESAGGGTGTLGCSSACVFDYSACSVPFVCTDDESEPNNTFATAIRIDRTSSPTSFVLQSGNPDVFRMLQAPGCTVTVTALFGDVADGWDMNFVGDGFVAIAAERTPIEGGLRLQYRVAGGGFGATTLYLLVDATEAAICAPYTLTFQSVCG